MQILARAGGGKNLTVMTPLCSMLLVLALALPATRLSAQTNLPLLTTARQVHQLTSEEAGRRYPVRLRGVVTFCDEKIGQLFVQDETGGIFIEIQGDYGFKLRRGQRLEIGGVSAPGGFAPDIVPQRIGLLGEASLPPVRAVTFEQMGRQGRLQLRRVHRNRPVGRPGRDRGVQFESGRRRRAGNDPD